MTRVTIDDSLSIQLGNIGQPVELYNSAGTALGLFVPMFRPDPNDHCPYSVEELAEMRREEGGRTLSEIWASLGVS